jgi:hypothetical protein
MAPFPQSERGPYSIYLKIQDFLAQGTYLAASFTGMGLKEWTFYARDRDLFMAQLNELLQGHPMIGRLTHKPLNR